MQKTIRILSLLLAMLLTAAYLPMPASAQRPVYDGVAGATGGGGGGHDDESFGNSAVDPSLYSFTPFEPGSITGTSLAALMEATPVFYYGGAYTQLMYRCIKGYAYMFYLYGDSCYDYVAISYGYEDAIDVSDASVWNSLYIGTLNTGGEPGGGAQTFTGTAAVDDAEGSFLTLNVYVESSMVSALEAEASACVGSWDNIVERRSPEYVGRGISSASEFDAVSSATPYSAAIKTAVLDALDLEAEQPDEPEEPEGAPAHEKSITAKTAAIRCI